VVSLSALVAPLALTACGSSNPTGTATTTTLTVVKNPPTVTAPTTIVVSSPVMSSSSTVPDEYTCVGTGISPPLAWSNIPATASQLALVITDPDAPGGTFFHWTTYRFSPTVASVPSDSVPTGALQGLNGGGEASYYPMCPPKGDPAHHYHFTVYALRSPIGIGEGATPTTVMDAIQRAAIAQGVLVVPFAQP
jgi:Raf kinase inhibitor-like YbhB/YbcL family protein